MGQQVQGGDGMMAGDQLTVLVSWLQQPEARHRAHDELRHLGLPAVLADDLLGAAAYALAVEADRRQRPFTTADPRTPACRALTSAARSLLRARRTAAAGVPVTGTGAGADADADPGSPAIPVDPLEANRDVTDQRRRAVSALAGHRPHDRAAALTVLTLATEPTIEPVVDLPVALPADDLDRQAWIGLWYAGHADGTLPASTSRRAAQLAHADRQQAAIARVRRLLAAAVAVDGGVDGPGLVDRGAGPAEPAAGVTQPPEPVHRRAAHG